MKILKLRTILASIILASIFANATDVTPYGFVRFNGVWSDGVSGSSNPNGVYEAGVEKGSFERASHFGFGVSQSTVGVNMRDSISEGKLILTGKFEGDFVHGYNLGLNQGFVNFSFPNIGLDILFGQTWALFVPHDPPTINHQNLVGTGNLAAERPQIRLTQKLSSLEVAVAARKDRDYPAVEGRIGTTTPIKIGTSAFWASEKIVGISSSYYYGEEKEPASWGIAADMFADIGILSISGEFFTGKNLSNYGGISNPYYQYIKFGVKSIGGWGALGVKASDDLSFNAGAGAERITNSSYWGSYPIPWFNMAIFANANYKLSPTATLALEYYRHNSKYMGDLNGAYNRVETAITYGF
jgi:hypothetical protein